jgi:hypothetical protein
VGDRPEQRGRGGPLRGQEGRAPSRCTHGAAPCGTLQPLPPWLQGRRRVLRHLGNCCSGSTPCGLGWPSRRGQPRTRRGQPHVHATRPARSSCTAARPHPIAMCAPSSAPPSPLPQAAGSPPAAPSFPSLEGTGHAVPRRKKRNRGHAATCEFTPEVLSAPFKGACHAPSAASHSRAVPSRVCPWP